MSSDSFYMIMDLLIALCGAYVIAQYVLMVMTKELRQNMLFPKETDVKKCTDVPGFIRDVGLKQLVFGIVSLASGLLGLVQDQTGTVNLTVTFVSIAAFAAAAAWYVIALKKAMKQYWKK